MPPQPVGYTEAREHALRRSLRLSGSVEARRSSLVASEVAGLVVELAAREGDLVERGRPLVKLRQTDLELQLAARRADLREAEARLDLAGRTLARNRDLFASEVISRQHLDDASSEQTAWQGRVDSLQAEIARVEDRLQRSTVAAPFTGVVVEEHTQMGQWLAVGGPVVELLDLEELEVVLDVPERHFAALKQGAPAQVSLEALPGAEIDGRISAVIPRAADETRTFPVKVRFANRGHRVGVGMLAQVSFGTGDAYAALVVPKDAVVRQGPQSVVYRIGNGNTVEPVPVATGGATGAWIEVQGPLKPGDRVVTRGNERLFPGQVVQPTVVPYTLP
jgi:RND family efflux transporter MFP subunit